MHSFLRNWYYFSAAATTGIAYDIAREKAPIQSWDWNFTRIGAMWLTGLPLAIVGGAMFKDDSTPKWVLPVGIGANVLITSFAYDQSHNPWQSLATGVATAGLLSAAAQLLPREPASPPKTDHLSHLLYEQKMRDHAPNVLAAR